MARVQLDGLVPLPELGPGLNYQGFTGGLYGGGSNQPPASLNDAALGAAVRIVPRDPLGNPSSAGKVGVIAIGQSTTMQWFPYFQRIARQLPMQFVFVNAGQDGMVAQSWANSSQPWSTAQARVRSTRLTRYQVQVAILDSARTRSWNDGGLQAQVAAYSADLSSIIHRAKSQFPNLSLVYILPFHYAGYANSRQVVQEPFGYQLGFGIQRLVETQGDGSTVLLWGPYVWGSTANPSYYYDGIHHDGIHFTAAGRAEMAGLMWNFLQTDPAAQRWLWNS